MANQKEIFLKDYAQPNYWVENLNLEFDFYDDYVLVTNTASYTINKDRNLKELALNGVDLELVSIELNGKTLDNSTYNLEEDLLSLKELPEVFTLKVENKIFPDKNFTGEGLYKSGNIYCTQCEAEGFRRITYYQDRPDVMTKYRCTIRGNKEKFPYLLSNGNKVESLDLPNGIQQVTWEDPHNKPSYLFALVAGDLEMVSDVFTTQSGQEVALEIYVDPGNADKCPHAMESLKKSMKWDEDVFGLEYDLSTYMIVAVDSFNMGAMENKGLNIFNSSYVLAKQETATDSDFQNIEAVIGHEYFHNWTGNRVTCRDWFQLTLKEGLTVFRDQEFSSDMLSRSVKRIEDVKTLKRAQFPEDNGPLSHPIKPKSFVEINNFYTATVYEKGAEVIRMIHSLIGVQDFRKGMDLYFDRHDGQAVTTEDFVQAMADASGKNFEHFKTWYDQNGTPKLRVESSYDENLKTCTLIIKQSVKTNNEKYSSLHFPFHISLYSKTGEKFELPNDGKIELSKVEEKLVFENIDSDPVVSLNENFTAPVDIEYSYTEEDLKCLMSFCQDDFNRYNATQILIEKEIDSVYKVIKQGEAPTISQEFVAAYKNFLMDSNLDPSFKAYALSIPNITDLNNKRDQFDFEALPEAIKFVKRELSKDLYSEINEVLRHFLGKEEFYVNAQAMGKRAYKTFLLDLLFASESPEAIDLVYSVYQNANNMTEQFFALKKLLSSDNPYQEKASQSFYEQWKSDTLVMQKWLSAHAVSELVTIDKLKELEQTDIYNPKVPNLLRSLVSSYCAYNTKSFHNGDGSGYAFLADKILETDIFNPQIAAGLCKRFNFLNKLDNTRKEKLTEQLHRIQRSTNISNDLSEVVSKNLS